MCYLCLTCTITNVLCTTSSVTLETASGMSHHSHKGLAPNRRGQVMKIIIEYFTQPLRLVGHYTDIFPPTPPFIRNA